MAYVLHSTLAMFWTPLNSDLMFLQLKAICHATEGFMPGEGPQSWWEQGGIDCSPRRAQCCLGYLWCKVSVFLLLPCSVLMQARSPGPGAQNDNEHSLSPALAEQDARALQESFESAVCGEDEDNDKEDDRSSNRNRNSGSDEDEDEDDGGSVPAMMAPGLSTP